MRLIVLLQSDYADTLVTNRNVPLFFRWNMFQKLLILFSLQNPKKDAIFNI